MAAVALLQYSSGAAITAVLHPFGYAKVLMQMGHEPLAPELSSTFLLRKPTLSYPNIFQYIGHIRATDGFWGMYRGVGPRVIAGTVGNLVQYNVQDRVKAKREEEGRQDPPEDEELPAFLYRFCIETSEDSLSRCCGIIASHPFHVIMIRSMVQFIGRETEYNSILSSIQEIYRNDGILGFFAGLAPRLVGEMLTLWLTNFLAQALNKYLVEEKDMKSYTGAACGLIVSHVTYPFTLITNIMAVNGSGLRGGRPPLMPLYGSWLDCLFSLSAEGSLKRGASAFWRTVKPAVGPPAVMAYRPAARSATQLL